MLSHTKMGKTWSISCQQWVLNSVYEILFSGLSVVRVMERVVKTLFSANTSHLHSVCFWWCFENCGGGFSANTSNIHSLCFWWCEGDGAAERVVKPHFQATPPTFTLSVVDDVVRVTERVVITFASTSLLTAVYHLKQFPARPSCRENLPNILPGKYPE